MTSTPDHLTTANCGSELAAALERQRAYFNDNNHPTLAQRRAKLDALQQAIISHKDAITQAVAQDFGKRSALDTQIADIAPSLHLLKYCNKNLSRWMTPVRRKPGISLSPAKLRVHYQPLGVIGIIVPWNFPIGLALSPLITAIAAGNTAMLKMSEFTPATNQVIKELLAQAFASDQVAVVEGDVEVASRFSKLAFDHLIFTGSTEVGKHIMRAAAENLTPVTLELGGKSPTVIAPDFDITDAVERIAFSKSLNAGQVCVAPDYILLPKQKVSAFISAYKHYFNTLYPLGIHSEDYTSVVNNRQYQRLKSVIEDAKQHGAVVHTVTEQALDDINHRMTPHLIEQVSDEMQVMQQELFGPVLPIIPYEDIQQAHAFISARPRPLALYLMSFDESVQRFFIEHSHSGGMCINDSLVHVAAEDAPFGGIGPSGMGHYHGIEGFKTLSHAKTVLTRGKTNYTKMLHPPHNTWFKKCLAKVLNA
ncbi:coniferyl aldehyde dehydrogenase [Motilimonas pumila]|uniref:Aldehyde dehydrogenase n=1 Tax=Motilimonas pumila TaxID=2303987 RepID=A0A418YDG9_9GAMM|nr:coniferyl aldehyde dehydrogenase [Motilimonas pumila]RJG42572.1 coniferyl aldehyde dehydrogenase [Motilimonas pumila]